MYKIEGWSSSPLTTHQIEDLIVNRKLPKQAVNSNSEQRARQSKTLVYAGNQRLAATPRPPAKINFPHVQFRGHQTTPAIGIRENYPSFGYMEAGVHGLSVFLNAVTIVDLLHQKEAAAPDDEIFGSITNNFWLNITLASISAIDDSYKAGQSLLRTPIAQSAISTISKKLFSRLSKNVLYRANSISLFLSQSKSIAYGSKFAQGAARFAGIAGVLLTTLQSGSALAQGKYAKAWGNALVALGGGILLAFGATLVGAVIGLLVIVFGIVIEYFGALDPVQEWAKSSFWGESNWYWGDRRVPISLLIDESVIMAVPKLVTSKPLPQSLVKRSAELQKFFEQEVEAFNNIYNVLSILTKDNQKKPTSQIYLPYLGATENIEDRVKINIQIEHNAEDSWFLNDDYKKIPFNYDINYKNQIITIDFSSSLPSKSGFIEEVEYTPAGRNPMSAKATIYKHTIPEYYLYQGHDLNSSIDDYKWTT